MFISGLFDRAKRKFLGDKEEDVGSDGLRSSSAGVTSQSYRLFDVDYWQTQDIGMSAICG